MEKRIHSRITSNIDTSHALLAVQDQDGDAVVHQIEPSVSASRK